MFYFCFIHKVGGIVDQEARKPLHFLCYLVYCLSPRRLAVLALRFYLFFAKTLHIWTHYWFSCLSSTHCYFQPSVRFEACRGLYRLSLIKENSCLIQLMDALLDSLPLAQSLQSRESSHSRRQEPSASQYFSILCRLVDGLPSVEGGEKVQHSLSNTLSLEVKAEIY